MADTRSDAEKAATLGKPGAGLPFHQALMLRWVVGPLVAARSDWDKDNKKFESVNDKILALADDLEDEQLSQRILVPPQYGLEDSSRYWSPAMVMEHIVIVGTGIRNIVASLSKGVVPDLKVDTGRVKPKGAMTTEDAIQNFAKFRFNTIAELEKEIGDRNSKTTLPHPWFGPFTARQWHWLLAAHSVIHLQQMREISSRLNPEE